MIDRLAVATEGFRSNAATNHRPLAIATHGWMLLAEATPSTQPVRIGGGGGGALPLFVPGIAAEPKQPDYAMRAKTMAASMGVAMKDGDLALKLAATLGLLLTDEDDT